MREGGRGERGREGGGREREREGERGGEGRGGEITLHVIIINVVVQCVYQLPKVCDLEHY